jgi:hypothetical protein
LRIQIKANNKIIILLNYIIAVIPTMFLWVDVAERETRLMPKKYHSIRIEKQVTLTERTHHKAYAIPTFSSPDYTSSTAAYVTKFS